MCVDSDAYQSHLNDKTLSSKRSKSSSTSTSSTLSTSSYLSYLSTLPKRNRDLVNQMVIDCPILNAELLGIIAMYLIPSTVPIVAGISSKTGHIMTLTSTRTSTPTSTPTSTRTSTPTSEWSEMTTFITNRSEFMMCSMQEEDIVMIAGGRYSSDDGRYAAGITSKVTQYTISTGKWTDLPSLPEPISEAANAVVYSPYKRPKWHIIGGQTIIGNMTKHHFINSINSHYQWDNETKQWTILPEYPIASCNMAAVSFQGSLVVSGGSTSSVDGIVVFGGNTNFLEATDAVYRFDDSTQEWMIMPSLVHKRHSHTIIAHGNNLFVIGGYVTDTNDKYDIVEMYSSVSNKWEILDWTLPVPFLGTFVCTAIDDTLYLVGGLDWTDYTTMTVCWKTNLLHLTSDDKEEETPYRREPKWEQLSRIPIKLRFIVV
jgi:N-acetylneuraminic acid mutarotase